MEFSLQEWREGFAPSLAESADDIRIARMLRDGFPHPYTLRDAEAFIAYTRSAVRELHRAVVVEGRAVGALSLTKRRGAYNGSAELGYWLAPDYWGHGIMTEAVRLLIGEAFLWHDTARVYAELFTDNLASRRVLEKCGFRMEGVLPQSVRKGGALLDSCIYGLTREEWKKNEDRRRQ